METKSQAKGLWKYILLFAVLLASGPTTHFFNQALRGYPLDINYFWTELSPFGLLGGGIYNGNGGVGWKIGKAKATIWNAGNVRSLPELSSFALELANRDRTLNNLPPLQADSALSLASQLHAEDMLDRQYFDHISPDGKTPRDRYLAISTSPLQGVGENIVQGETKGLGLTYREAEKFQRGWMYSNGHRANLLTDKYTKFGYGVVTGANGQIYAVQMFGI